MADEPFQRVRRFLRELKRRNVYKVAVAYLTVAFVGLQAARLLVPATTLPGWADQFFIFLAVAGFPVSLVVAWAFEMTPGGVRRTEAAEPETAERGAIGGAGGWIAALGVLVLAGGGYWYLTGGGEEAAPTGPTAATDTAGSGDRGKARSIAVLPFDNLSGTEEAEPFVNGLHDDLLTRLSNISELTVISRTSVLPYRETELSLPAIADSLDVRWIVEGGIQQAGDQVQVNAQLIQAEEDAHRWAETYRRKLTTENIFAIQSELTKKIAGSLEAELTPEESERVGRQPTQDLSAYKLYVRGRLRLGTRTEDAMREAVEHFRRAIARDSGYALAWSGLADAQRLLAYYGHGSPDTLSRQALRAARRAVELDADLAEAHASLGGLYHTSLQNLPLALRELKRAVELEPSYDRAHMWLAELWAALGREDRALEHAKKSVELNPNSPVNHLVLGVIYWWTDGPGQTALEQVRRASELEPGYALAHVNEGEILSEAGRPNEAIAALRRGLERTSKGSFAWTVGQVSLGLAHVRNGDTARAREFLTRLEGRRTAPLQKARLYAALREESAAFEALGDVEWMNWKRWDLRFMSEFTRLRDDPRFQEMLREARRSIGLNPDGSLPDSVDVSFGSESDG